MPNFSDNYTMHVLYNENACIDVTDSSDGQSTNPGGTVHILFTYRGGIGTGRAGSFNIFLYDRSDVSTDGTPDAPEANLPAVFGVTPSVPRAGATHKRQFKKRLVCSRAIHCASYIRRKEAQ